MRQGRRLAGLGRPTFRPPRSHGQPLALIADVGDLQPTAEVEEFSSLRVVWEACRAELLIRPHAIGGDAAGYLHAMRSRLAVAEENFPQTLFLERLIEPAYCIGIAKWLLRERVPLQLFGQGWDAIDDLAARAAGPITTRDALAQATRSAAALIDPFFVRANHPIRSLQIPTIPTFGRSLGRVLQDITTARARAA